MLNGLDVNLSMLLVLVFNVLSFDVTVFLEGCLENRRGLNAGKWFFLFSFVLRRNGANLFSLPRKLATEENWLQSISSTFYEKHIFCTKVFVKAFLYLQFVFVIFCRKEIGKKAAHSEIDYSALSLNFERKKYNTTMKEKEWTKL